MQLIMSSIAANLQGVNSLVAAAHDAAVRSRPSVGVATDLYAKTDLPSVTVVAVSKTKPAAAIEAAFAAGQRHFGENYVQEAVEKIDALAAYRTEGIVWHLIGPLQSNKARLVAPRFDWVQSIDREKIATALHMHRPHDLLPLNVLIQVNVSGEVQKGGVPPGDVMVLAEAIDKLDRLRLRGVMSIVENTADEAALRVQFSTARRCFVALREAFSAQSSSCELHAKSRANIDTLSIGMSQDFEIAIEEGSNMVRIGRAIFGERA